MLPAYNLHMILLCKLLVVCSIVPLVFGIVSWEVTSQLRFLPLVQVGFPADMLLLSPRRQGNVRESLDKAAAAAADNLARLVHAHHSH